MIVHACPDQSRRSVRRRSLVARHVNDAMAVHRRRAVELVDGHLQDAPRSRAIRQGRLDEDVVAEPTELAGRRQRVAARGQLCALRLARWRGRRTSAATVSPSSRCRLRPPRCRCLAASAFRLIVQLLILSSACRQKSAANSSVIAASLTYVNALLRPSAAFTDVGLCALLVQVAAFLREV